MVMVCVQLSVLCVRACACVHVRVCVCVCMCMYVWEYEHELINDLINMQTLYYYITLYYYCHNYGEPTTPTQHPVSSGCGTNQI